MKSFTAAAALAFVSVAAARTFTVYNNCPFTIWPGMYTNPQLNTEFPDHPNGWEAPAYSSVTFNVPDHWTSGRIWVSKLSSQAHGQS